MKRLLILFLLTGCADDLSQINHEVNQEPYIAKLHDCRNFAEEKYKKLIQKGYKSEDMKFVITDYNKQPHVVLNVDGVILDNNYDKPYYASKALQDGMTYKTWKYYRNSI